MEAAYFRGDIVDLKELLLDFIKGNSYYHLWYMYMLLGVYFLIPFIVYIRKNISRILLIKGSIFLLVWSCLSLWTSNYQLEWDIGRAFCYLSYALIGYTIFTSINVKNNTKGTVIIIVGLLIECVIAFVQYTHSIFGISESMEKLSIIAPSNPFILGASVLVFSGFCYIDFHRSCKRLAGMTFYIYLIHAGVFDLFLRIIGSKLAFLPCVLIMMIAIITTFLLSYVLAMLYKKVYSSILHQTIKPSKFT